MAYSCMAGVIDDVFTTGFADIIQLTYFTFNYHFQLRSFNIIFL